jgi:hypothetical protein
MRRTTFLAVTCLSSSLMGCAIGSTRTAEVDPEMVCADRTVTVFQSTGFLAVYPEYIHVCPGRSITVKAVPPAPGTVRTIPERGNPVADDWLNAESERGEGAVMRVPESAAEGVYKYNIAVEGIGTLDPRVSVVRR